MKFRDLFNMTNTNQIHELYMKIKQRNLLFFKTRLQICWLIGGIEVMNKTKFQLSISNNMPARPKTQVNTTIIIFCLFVFYSRIIGYECFVLLLCVDM